MLQARHVQDRRPREPEELAKVEEVVVHARDLPRLLHRRVLLRRRDGRHPGRVCDIWRLV